MIGPLRRWRTFIVVAAVFIFVCWYLWAPEDSTFYRGAPSRPPFGGGSGGGGGGGGGGNDGEVRWHKLPERHPVASLRPLPTGAPAMPIPRVQHQPAPTEDREARRIREARLAAVKDSFRHSWAGYKEHAWLSDEVMPLSGRRKDPFGGWAATLVDALDTLWIMDLRDEFRQAVLASEQIDFATTRATSINVFETTIRYLGGFLAAYELSDKKYPTLLDKAVEVAELLMCAFDTPNRMPIPRWTWKEYMNGKAQTAPRSVVVSELGSLTLEFTKMSQLTGDMKYYDAVQRISDAFEVSQGTTRLPGMWPIGVDAFGPSFDQDNGFTLGGMSDSLYEYFPKQYLLLGGALEQPRKMYDNFIDVAKKHLFRRAMNPDNIPLIISGDAKVNGQKPDLTVVTTAKGQHLTCFVGGMVGLAARIFGRDDEMDTAVQLTDACVWSYNATASGIGPEIFSFVPCGSVEDSQTGEKCEYTERKWRNAVHKYWRPNDPAEPETEAKAKAVDDDVSTIITSKRLPPGMVDVSDRRYILRPEAIESVFIMYRLTGDSTWMDKAWNMFQHVETHTRGGIASASLDDVTLSDPTQVDSMESFWLAETLKYYYLIFAEWDKVDLDKWVLNTEAHPLKRPDVSSWYF